MSPLLFAVVVIGWQGAVYVINAIEAALDRKWLHACGNALASYALATSAIAVWHVIP